MITLYDYMLILTNILPRSFQQAVAESEAFLEAYFSTMCDITLVGASYHGPGVDNAVVSAYVRAGLL
jgi:hypothetical protein